ncbi:MAG: ribosome maturation factor RimM [Treponema sp.]|nr:ribosome maturation factor RimM [Treponema sp.]
MKIRPSSGEIDHFFRLETVTLRQGGVEVPRKVAETVPHGNALLMRFDGVTSPEAAKLLTGAEIVVDREFAAPLRDGEHYIEDMKGLAVVSAEGQTLGHIADVLEGGGGQLAEVTLSSGETRLAPYRKEFFGELNLAEGTIVLLAPWVLDAAE